MLALSFPVRPSLTHGSSLAAVSCAEEGMQEPMSTAESVVAESAFDAGPIPAELIAETR